MQKNCFCPYTSEDNLYKKSITTLFNTTNVLGQKTAQGTVLYLCLEDSYVRIQNRLYEITDEPTERLHFVIMSESIGGGLEEQIENFKKEHSDLKVMFIDTFQMIRSETDSNYSEKAYSK